MISKAILVSTPDDLSVLDKMNLNMSGIAVVSKITQALEPIVENKINCLIISDKVIEEQSSLAEIAKQLDVIYKLYPRKIRVIYYKIGNDKDQLVRLLDDNSNWDIYYNTEIKYVGNEGIYSHLKDRKISYEDKNKSSLESVRSALVSKANNFSALLSSTISKGVMAREELNSIILRDLNSVLTLSEGFTILKDELTKSSSKVKELESYSEKLNEIIKDLRNKLLLTNESLTNTESIRKALQSELLQLHNKHNALVDSLKDIIRVTEVNSSLTEVISTKNMQNPPLVIYIKEVTNVRYLTTFLVNLTQFLTHNIGLSKLVVIENDFNTKSIPLYEEKGLQYITDGSPMESLILGNLITTGINNKLMNYLLHNSLQIDTLIIYDRTQLNESLVVGTDVVNFFSLGDLEDAKVFDLDGKLIISNSLESVYSIGKIKDFANAKGNRQVESSILNSLKLTKQLTSFIRKWREHGLDENVGGQEVVADAVEENTISVE